MNKNNKIIILTSDPCNMDQASSSTVPPPQTWEDIEEEEEDPLPNDSSATLLSMKRTMRIENKAMPSYDKNI